ncbi:MAG: hypothetical protein CO141_03825 [Candidatus Moranbacteria bacterium CG_4_9_14_3_um_filter_42_9]|nr:MAG: hypothetical protein CO141_03825 [Candidatus Moranbacteria bacterium CG_4_9_14_3_um_filter_42_9]
MTIHIYQIIVVGISVVMIYSGIESLVRGKSGQTLTKLLIRIFVWGGMSLIALFPSFTNILASLVGLQGNINAVILTVFLLIFLMIFKLLSAIERLEQSISELTRKESLEEIKKK